MDEEVGSPYLFMVEEKQKIKGKKTMLDSRDQQWIILGLIFAIFALTTTFVYYVTKVEHSLENSGKNMNNSNQYY